MNNETHDAFIRQQLELVNYDRVYVIYLYIFDLLELVISSNQFD